VPQRTGQTHLFFAVGFRPDVRHKGKDNEGQNRGQDSRGFTSQTCRNTYCCSEPETCRSRQSVNLLRLIVLEDSPGPEEPGAGNNPLENAAHIREQHPGLVGNQDKECGAKGDKHMRPESRLLPFSPPFEPQEPTEERRKQQAHNNLGDLSGPRQIGKICLHPSPYLLPYSAHYSPTQARRAIPTSPARLLRVYTMLGRAAPGGTPAPDVHQRQRDGEDNRTKDQPRRAKQRYPSEHSHKDE
jgi:hypothetical protein